MIDVQDASVRIGGRAILDSVSLTLKPAEVTTLIGPNGAGKSTLFNVMTGDLAPTSGQVLLDDRPVLDYSPRDLAQIRAVLPQDHAVRFSFSVEEIVRPDSCHRGVSLRR